MGQIHENLVLTDGFSASFSRFLTLGEQAVENTQQLDVSIREMADASRNVSIQGMNEINQTLLEIQKSIDTATDKQREYNETVRQSGLSMSDLLKKVRNLAVVSAGIKLGKSFLELSDTQTQINARLNLMKDEQHSVAQLNDLIYQSALRSRAAYIDTADAVGKMGLNAKNAFSSNKELIAFTEQVNKQFLSLIHI